MRKITMWFVATVAILVLLLSYRTSRSGPSGLTRQGVTANAPGIVVNGVLAQTRWGPVQVQIRISDGKITDVQALVVPQENSRDVEINAYAVPQLRVEVLVAQSANIDIISGATVTSDGYIRSLQSALDSAHFTG